MLNAADRNEMLLTISDLSKDAFGYRVREDYASMTDEELLSDWNFFMREANASIIREREEEANNMASWKAKIGKMMADLAVDFDTAVRWDMDAHDVDGDVGYYMWHYGVHSFENTDRVKALLEG